MRAVLGAVLVGCLLTACDSSSSLHNSAGLVEAARDGDVSKIRSLLRSGADPNSTDDGGASALTAAVVYANVEIVQLLVDSGAKVDQAIVDEAARGAVLPMSPGATTVMELIMREGRRQKGPSQTVQGIASVRTEMVDIGSMIFRIIISDSTGDVVVRLSSKETEFKGFDQSTSMDGLVLVIVGATYRASGTRISDELEVEEFELIGLPQNSDNKIVLPLSNYLPFTRNAMSSIFKQ